MCKTIEITEKRCSKCGEVKPAEEFNKYNRGKYRYHGWCKKCHYEYMKKWQKENKDKVNKASKKWRKANPEKQKSAIYKWRKENPEKQKSANNKWRKENSERIKKNYVDYYEKNNVKIKERVSQYYIENIDKIKPKRSAYNDRIVKSLSDVYIKRQIKNQFGLTTSEMNQLEIAPQLIELKRISIKSKRILNHKKLKV